MQKDLMKQIDSLFNEISNDIEIHIIDKPMVEIEGVRQYVNSSRALNIKQLIDEINRKIKKGDKHVYIYDFYHEKVNVVKGVVDDEVIYENLDTYWIRWFFTK